MANGETLTSTKITQLKSNIKKGFDHFVEKIK
jgi:hypothetical protein